MKYVHFPTNKEMNLYCAAVIDGVLIGFESISSILNNRGKIIKKHHHRYQYLKKWYDFHRKDILDLLEE